MAENKNTLSWKFYLAELIMVLAGTMGMWLVGLAKELPTDRLLGNCVSFLLCFSGTFLYYRKACENYELDYDNNEHRTGFMICIVLGLLIAFVCSFLPAAGWPYLLVFIMTSLFSNMNVGLILSATLLLIPVLLTNGTIHEFMLYFISGFIGITLFQRMKECFKIGYSLFLSLLCLLVCETANVVIVTNARPDLELFVMPVSNVIINGILLLGGLKIFSDKVIYKYRSVYLEINDTENEVLKTWREKDKKSYMLSIHIAYFCERIGNLLHLDTEGLKCAALYFKLYEGKSKTEFENKFPPNAIHILSEYSNRSKGFHKKETAVLLCSELIVSSITFIIEKTESRTIDYGKIVDTVFQKLLVDGSLQKCELTMNELYEVKKIFKEEKLYYDFLR